MSGVAVGDDELESGEECCCIDEPVPATTTITDKKVIEMLGSIKVDGFTAADTFPRGSDFTRKLTLFPSAKRRLQELGSQLESVARDLLTVYLGDDSHPLFEGSLEAAEIALRRCEKAKSLLPKDFSRMDRKRRRKEIVDKTIGQYFQKPAAEVKERVEPDGPGPWASQFRQLPQRYERPRDNFLWVFVPSLPIKSRPHALEHQTRDLDIISDAQAGRFPDPFLAAVKLLPHKTTPFTVERVAAYSRFRSESAALTATELGQPPASTLPGGHPASGTAHEPDASRATASVSNPPKLECAELPFDVPTLTLPHPYMAELDALSPLWEKIEDSWGYECQERIHKLLFTTSAPQYPSPCTAEPGATEMDVADSSSDMKTTQVTGAGVKQNRSVWLDGGCPVMVDNGVALRTMIDEIVLKEDLVAVDVEYHSEHSYRGFICLIQISSRSKDWIVDPAGIAAASMNDLNEIFCNPAILKVMHGTDSDVIWLQHDYSLYLVNVFDTFFAAKALSLPGGFGLKNLVFTYCQVELDKAMQLKDWRERPLTERMIRYAAQDTHYLPYVFDCMRNQILTQINENSLPPVWDASLPVTIRGRRIMRQCLESSRNLCRKRVSNGPANFELAANRICQAAGDTLNTGSFETLVRLIALRDLLGRSRDLAPSTIVSDVRLLNLAKTLPRRAIDVENCLRGSQHYLDAATIHQLIAHIGAVALEMEPETFISPHRTFRHKLPPKPGANQTVFPYTSHQSSTTHPQSAVLPASPAGDTRMIQSGRPCDVSTPHASRLLSAVNDEDLRATTAGKRPRPDADGFEEVRPKKSRGKRKHVDLQRDVKTLSALSLEERRRSLPPVLLKARYGLPTVSQDPRKRPSLFVYIQNNR